MTNDTHVYFQRNEIINRGYLKDAIDKFAEETGFEIEGGWI